MVEHRYAILPLSSTIEDISMLANDSYILQIAVIAVFVVVGALLNILVVFVFHKRPALKSPSSRFISSLVAANLTTTLVATPAIVIQIIAPAASSWLHPISSGLITFAVLASIFSLLAIAADRYYAVHSPLHYSMTVTRQRSLGILVVVWLAAFILAIPNIFGYVIHYPAHFSQTMSFDFRPLDNCTVTTSNEVYTLTYSFILFALGFTFPLFALLWFYCKMYKAAHQNSERTRRHSVCTGQGETVSTSVPGSRGGSLELPGPPNNATPDHLRRTWRNPPLAHLATKRRSSNASFSALFFKEEGRAIKTATMVVSSFLICWAPHFVTVVLDAWGTVGYSTRTQTDLFVPDYVRFISLLCVLLNSIITPIIYVFRNETVQKETLKLMLWCKKEREKYNSNMIRCSRDLENGKDGLSKSLGFGPSVPDNFSLRRQSLSQHSDTVSVQSFQIPPHALPECHHCGEKQRGFGTADFVATYDIIESTSEEDLKDKTSQNVHDSTSIDSTNTVAIKTRRESVTFRLAFLPQRRCQTCIRQNSDSSSGSGQPLVRESCDSTERVSPPFIASSGVVTSSLVRIPASQRRKRFLLAQQGSSGDELTASSSEPGTPRQLAERRHECINMQNDLTNDEHMLTCTSVNDDRITSDVILELDEPINGDVHGLGQQSEYFQFQEGNVPMSASQEHYQGQIFDPGDISSRSDSTTRQDSNFSDITVDSGVVADIGIFNRSHSSSSSISSSSIIIPQRPKRQRHKLQRLAAVEDEEGYQITPPETPTESTLDSVSSKLKSSFKSRFQKSFSKTVKSEC